MQAQTQTGTSGTNQLNIARFSQHRTYIIRKKEGLYTLGMVQGNHVVAGNEPRIDEVSSFFRGTCSILEYRWKGTALHTLETLRFCFLMALALDLG